MEIIFAGKHTSEEIAENLISVLDLFKERYQIKQFRELHVSVTLVNNEGDDVELVDSETSQTYRVFEVYRSGHELNAGRNNPPLLQLVIDNTR